MGLRRIFRLLSLAVMAGLVGGSGTVRLLAAPELRPPLVGVTLASGVIVPSQEAVRSLYGRTQVPFHGQVNFFLGRGFSLFAGVRYVRQKGSTQVAGRTIVEEHHPLEFRMVSARAGPEFSVSLRAVHFTMGMGLSHNWVQERWLDVPLNNDLKKWGLFVRAGIDLDLGRQWAIILRLEYSTVPTGRKTALGPRVNLGGNEVILGLLFRL